MTTTPTIPTHTRPAYLAALREALATLQPVAHTASLQIGRLDITVDADNSKNLVTAVEVRTNTYRSRVHRYTKIDVAHVAAQVRRLVAETQAAQEQRALHARQREAWLAREQAARAPLDAVIEAINVRSCAAQQGRVVTGVEVEEEARPAGGGYAYRFELCLHRLSELEALAVLAIVEARYRAAEAPSLAELAEAFDVPDEAGDTSRLPGAPVEVMHALMPKTVATALCGAETGGVSYNLAEITCAECRAEMEREA